MLATCQLICDDIDASLTIRFCEYFSSGVVACSAAANVYTEWVLKKFKHDPFFWQNVQLYSFSTVFTLVALIHQQGIKAALDLASPEFLMTHVSGMAILAMLMQVAQVSIRLQSSKHTYFCLVHMNLGDVEQQLAVW